jgi:hypothetical protein
LLSERPTLSIDARRIKILESILEKFGELDVDDKELKTIISLIKNKRDSIANKDETNWELVGGTFQKSAVKSS